MSPSDATITHALDLAIQASWEVKGTTSPNPPVGAAIIDATGNIAGVGATQPPGGAHAEVMALARAGAAARGGTAVVTLEPCNHTGRTGPCTQALLRAGIARVYYAHPDPGEREGGGAEALRSQGVEVHRIPAEVAPLRPWLIATYRQRPHVTLKFAQTLDGFTAALDGTSQWITGEEARAQVHLDRSRRDAIIIGTGTAWADRPALTARRGDGLYPHQPRRVVIGQRALPEYMAEQGFEQYPGISQALAALWEKGDRDVLIEGGARLARSALHEDVVDTLQAYLAPVLLGGGRGVVDKPLVETLGAARRWRTREVRRLGPDTCIEMERGE
ncbi:MULTISPECIES: bifunctional diaminohydroxyphosphoribosylaminopyrimidine deaminase/5-amino-6-(5-phosphoribosylamino)uracil reductase RibD [unclassified Corynebacterium]|uniref:bifunctional diaminohydroxyphosphoribosylaminopyrimidine deaminase/5-amino-6-(5-phosphoribosylamino)uracil reductase RibD n=1 Tax=unclassified Corynebacterium TaxID=2624378 RepID=UPI0029CA3AC9|nr:MULTISPECIES: bifunctional diaminohydroxyphosphoribosylaminopyrimidine deaminase/5-amino-6-(5-phosphoribosylamino)uracil reductase RibD [unclassified Corynebacterium]WPF65147.1 bifunctional diaminohydroxyphosphoribosylaminopyrimidine deaminase/5-amino-6-(5-phosphoribosylamino)uracil reductase RibD [Corynebacterium sp. 22KM0430]WPF67643.1 bifunctional diaminohydroxyphosphoribosylaminopyrimidine deaminase/5-amino-6-(5-phosphoribosylamino)uracil reductase RibD [Corynebacterium sp. 21KM1197]